MSLSIATGWVGSHRLLNVQGSRTRSGGTSCIAGDFSLSLWRLYCALPAQRRTG